MISGFRKLTKNIPSSVKAVVIRMDRVPYVDQSGLYAMEDTILELKQNGITVLIWGIGEQPMIMFEKIDIIPDLVSYDECFDSAEEIESYLEQKLF